MKIENFEKKKVLRYGGEGDTHRIWPGSMQRFLRNLSLRTMDACTMTVALLTKSSRAKNEKRKKDHKNVKIENFEGKNKIWSGDMVDR